MSARVAASREVLRWHLRTHRAAGCPSEAPIDTKCPRCAAVLVLSCSDCGLPLFIAASPCTGNDMVPYGAAA